MTVARPSLFIGSSVEGLDIAYCLQEALEFDAEPTVWSQGVFRPTAATLSDLLRVARTTDFAAFVFSPDDIRIMRDPQSATIRDNVVFELGLMIGARGPERCFFLMRSDAKMALPTDLIGLTGLTYVSARRDGNLVAALGPAANKIRRTVRELGPVNTRTVEASSEQPPDPQAETAEFLLAWNSGDLLAARERIRAGVPMHMAEDETGQATRDMRLLFAFLESMADGVLAGRLDEAEARRTFSEPLHAFWRHARTFLAPLNGADEWWSPPPRMAELDDLWRGATR
ncbi:nucleotide-binding protein [Phenylobacterium sp.]|uniref:nucleotide-binding protein n=1 Tax=Phenylobacterium sp. TaxID=1871053 RepID=UPI003946916F